MIDILETVALIMCIAALAVLGSMLAMLIGTAIMGMIFDCLRWTRERYEALRQHHEQVRRQRVRQSSLREQLSTAQAEVEQLQYENQNLRRSMLAAGQTLPEPGKSLSVVRGDEPRFVHGVVEDRRR